MSASLLLMADGRWPTGGHAHSGGLEAAVRSGLVRDDVTLESWLLGRLMTVGEVDACFGAVAWGLVGSSGSGPGPGSGPRPGPGSSGLERLVEEYRARVPVPALREASRALGRAVLRAARATWPVTGSGGSAGAEVGSGGGWPWPVAFGVAGRSGGVDLSGVAVALALASVQGPAWAATRLMGLDPYRVAGCLARLGGAGGPVEEVAGRAVECTMDSLPSTSAPLLDIGAAQHSSWEVRLFAS